MELITTQAADRPARPRDLAAEVPAKKVGRLALTRNTPCTLPEVKFAEVFAMTRNAAHAYRESHDCTDMTYNTVLQNGWRVSHKPNVQKLVGELLDEAASEASVSVAALLMTDREIVEAYERHAGEVIQHVIEPCRRCHGIGHAYQWVDMVEYLAKLDEVESENEERRDRKQRPKPLPTDEGGYGFTRNVEASLTCPQCEGRGVPAVYFADTRTLRGPARLLVKGIKQGSQGQLEILMHDYEKAKERLYKAAGAFGDDAASVARGAAMGAAAGAAAAQQLSKRIDAMTEDEARKAYLTLV